MCCCFLEVDLAISACSKYVNLCQFYVPISPFLNVAICVFFTHPLLIHPLPFPIYYLYQKRLVSHRGICFMLGCTITYWYYY